MSLELIVANYVISTHLHTRHKMYNLWMNPDFECPDIDGTLYLLKRKSSE